MASRNLEQAARRQHQGIAVGEEDAPDCAAEAFAGDARMLSSTSASSRARKCFCGAVYISQKVQ
jgi:hypothetical protein